jgi:prepilin-type N-terminal cleavage/methylation domain-containing protein
MPSGSFLKKYSRGFTLVELMVSLFIMSISTGLLLANYPNSTTRIELLNDVHTFALLVREAQLRGSAVDSSANLIGGYGLFVNSATTSQSLFFADGVGDGTVKNSSGLSIGDGLYDTASDTVKSIQKLKDGFSFKKLCVASSTATGPKPKGFLCSRVNLTDAQNIKNLTISFTRPSNTAHIYVNGESQNDFDAACVQIYSLRTPEEGHVRSVLVYHSGIVTTTATACE